MSSKIKQMAKQIEQVEQVEQNTKIINYRIDVNIAGEGVKTTYMQVTGVPEDLPVEYESTVMRAAEAQFATALNQRTFLEFYSEGKSSRDEQPVFYNLSKVSWIKIENISKID